MLININVFELVQGKKIVTSEYLQIKREFFLWK